MLAEVGPPIMLSLDVAGYRSVLRTLGQGQRQMGGVVQGRAIEGAFEQLFLSDATLGVPSLEGERMAIPARNVGLMRGHPLNATSELAFLIQPCRLVFAGVASSRRVISEYTGEPTMPHFKDSKTVIVDGPFPTGPGQRTLFELEGVSEEPRGWISLWQIMAGSFHLET